jgi:hypothetical protein
MKRGFIALGFLVALSFPARGATCPALTHQQIARWGPGGCYEQIVVGVCSPTRTQTRYKCLPCYYYSYCCLSTV